jgi:branched-chain amino acid transport system substrate-binding protein
MASKQIALTLLVVGFGLAGAAAAPAQQKKYGPGVSDTEILLGNTVPYSGPASAVGQFGRAVGAYFEKVNAEGGVNGRKIRFVSLDDGYTPAKAVEQARKLVESEKVFAVVGNIGSAPNLATYRYYNQRKVPDFFIYAGLSRWNDPKNTPWVTGFIPTYVVEGRIYAKYILQQVKEPKIATLYQNDDSGKDYMRGLREGLGDQADKLIVASASYEVSDPTVDSQIIKLAASGANVFIQMGAPKAVAQAIRKAYDINWKPLQIINSPSSTVQATLVPAGLDKSVGILSATYLKDPTDLRWAEDPGYKEWLAWMKKYLPNASTADFLNVVGYNIGQLTVHLLKQCGDDLTRENLLKQVQNIQDVELPMLLPGIKVRSTPEDYRMVGQLQFQRFNGKQWELFGPLMSGE